MLSSKNRWLESLINAKFLINIRIVLFTNSFKHGFLKSGNGISSRTLDNLEVKNCLLYMVRKCKIDHSNLNELDTPQDRSICPSRQQSLNGAEMVLC